MVEKDAQDSADKHWIKQHNRDRRKPAQVFVPVSVLS